MNTQFVSIDIETLGLNRKAPIIEVALVVADWDTQHIIEEWESVVVHDRYDNCEPYAMSMHSELLRTISQAAFSDVTHIDSLGYELNWVLNKYGKITFAGKNAAGFDLPMLEEQIQLSRYIAYDYSVLDVGTLFWDPNQDSRLPNLETCKRRAGVDTPIAHRALQDARDVVSCVFHWVKTKRLSHRIPS